jgi:RNA-directed DNA polymerase
LNPTLRGWCNYFRHGVSSRTFNYVDHFAFWRIAGWLRKRHPGLSTHTVVRRYLPGWRISDQGIEMFRPYTVNIERYRYRGARIPTPWSSANDRITRTSGMNTWRAGCGGSRTSGSEGGPEKPTR